MEDRTFQVEDRTFQVEDRTFQVEDRTFNVADKTFNIADITLKVEDKVFRVEDKTFQVEDKVFRVEDKEFKVDASGSSGNAVGGEKFDTLALMVSTVKDQLMQVRTNLEEKITMVGSNNQTSNIDRQIASVIDSRLANINQDISGLRSVVYELKTNVGQKDNLYEYKFSDLDYRLNTALNITGAGRGYII